MQLRRTSGRACVHIWLAAVLLALAASPTALAVAEKPKPNALWQAFPLEPATKRPTSPLLPPAQERAEAVTTVTQAPPDDSGGTNLVALAFATLVVLLATVIVLSGRRLYVRRHVRSSSVPLWQGVAWPHYPNNLRELRSGTVRTSSALVGAERRSAETLPDVPAPRYRWADKRSARRFRPTVGADIGTMLHRLRRAAWTPDTAPAIIGAGVAVIVGILLVYLIG